MNYQEVCDAFKKAKIEKGEKLGIVLVGGGAKGRWEYGALLALEKMGVIQLADFFVGTSTGAIQAVLAGVSLYKTGSLKYGADVYAKVTKNSDIYTPNLPLDGFKFGNILSYLKLIPRLKKNGLVEPEGLRKLLADVCGDITADLIFAKTGISIWATATDRERRKTSVLGGPDRIVDMALASSAIPGAFPPHTIDGVEYVDGGLLDNHPVDQAVQLGATKILIVYCDPDPAESTPAIPREGVIGVALDSLDTLMSNTENEMWKRIDLQEQINAMVGGPSVEYLHVYPLSDTGTVLDFSKTELLEQGIIETWKQLNPNVVGNFLLS